MILLTGATGLVGSHILIKLLQSGHYVRALKRKQSNLLTLNNLFLHYNIPGNLLNKVEWIDMDLLDTYTMSSVFNHITQVYHCAALVSFHKKDAGSMMQTNTIATENIVNTALEKNIQKFCYISSVSTLNNNKYNTDKIITENSFWINSPDKSHYAISKYNAEREVWRASEEGLNTIIVNPSIILGPCNIHTSTGKIFKQCAKGLKYYPPGTSGFIDVRDVAQLTINLMEANIKGERFILNNENLEWKWVLDKINMQFHKPPPPIKINKQMANIALAADWIKSIFSNYQQQLTIQGLDAGFLKNKYDNNKLLKLFPDYKFISMTDCIENACDFFSKYTY